VGRDTTEVIEELKLNDLNTARYDARTVKLHWWVAVTILFMWGGAHAIDWFPKGPLRVDARSVHIVVGGLLLVAIIYRIFWRVTGGVHIKDAVNIQTIAAKTLHYALYLAIITTLALGIFNTWVRGDDLFGLGHIPQFGAYDKVARHEFANQIVGWHRLGANLILVLAGLHALAAIGHFLVLKDKVLQRMLPFTK
jgi:cytochrome b561